MSGGTYFHFHHFPLSANICGCRFHTAYERLQCWLRKKTNWVNVPNRYSHVLKCTCWRPVMHAHRYGPVIVQCTDSTIFPQTVHGWQAVYTVQCICKFHCVSSNATHTPSVIKATYFCRKVCISEFSFSDSFAFNYLYHPGFVWLFSLLVALFLIPSFP